MTFKNPFFVLIIILSSVSQLLMAENTVLNHFIEKDKTLERGVYIIENNVKISKDATLTVKSGSKLLFRKGASLKVDGGLILEGAPNNLIEITSENIQSEGYGIIISGINREKKIVIHFSKFSYLLVPLNFEKNWSRNKVIIEDNEFENIITGEASIIIKSVDEISSREEIPFSFSKNNFTKNNSSIFIEDLESDILNLRFNYNLITQNYFLGFEVGGRLNAPISVNYNKKELKYTTTFLGNSIFSNYLLHNTNDTVIQEVNFGIRGRAEKFSLDTNYFGIKSHIEIQKSFDHFNNHQASPYLSLNGILISPSDSVHGHIWKIAINTIVLEENANLPAITSQKLGMQINYNRPLLVRQGINYVSYIYFDETGKELKTKSLSCALKLDQINKNIQFTTNDDVYIKNPVGYFSFTGLTDNEGITVPKVYAGKEQFKIYLINNNLNFNLE